MAHDINPTERIDRFTRGIIHRKVRQLMGRAGFTVTDYEDLVQQFLLKVLESLAAFDPAKGHRNKFITAVVERFTATLVRNRRSSDRDFKRLLSLRTLVQAEDGRRIERAQTLSQEAHDLRLGRQSRNEQEQTDLAVDLAEALARLPQEDQDLARRLQSQSVTAIARERGMARTTLYEKVRRLRRCLERAGLRDYL